MNANTVIAEQEACLVVVEEGTKKGAIGSLYIGAQFQNLDVVRAMAHEEAIKSHVELMIAKSDCSRYRVVCKTDGCMWRLHASVVSGGPACEVKAFHDVHNCGGVSQLGNKEATTEWVASKYMEKFRDHPMYRPKELVADLRRECGVSISYKVVWKAKQVALGAIHGDHAKLMESFSHCRALIGLDGTFLTSKYLGALLTATGIDAMGALFLIAFGLVDAKHEDNWVWFLQNLHENLANVNGLCFISDKQKGLLSGMELVFPGCEHAYCMRHLDANLKKKCNNGEFIHLFWVAAYASAVVGYEEAIEGMKAINDLATTYLLNTSPPSHWATSYFKGKRYGHLTSNITESLNAWLLEARRNCYVGHHLASTQSMDLCTQDGGQKCMGVFRRWSPVCIGFNVEKNLRDIGNHA
ncbi:hypothetical protein L7F22_015234 [Adiantum nelumboides]|nr:hypothetical protein [Adiantum nelumboides]